MAEFQEVMRQKSRMCEKFFKHCGDCPLNVFGSCADPADDVLPAYEAVIMDWAKENPEPQYPTWKEWQKETFPEAECEISVCQFMKCDNAWNCESCRNHSIPSDIAKRLGIKPKGEKNG